MPSSDPFDDEAFFDELDLDVLEDAEAQAIQATQASASQQAGPSKRVTAPYHHEVTQPRHPFGTKPNGQPREPAPLNTEPRAGNTGFGWEYNGKRNTEGDVSRHVEMINRRQNDQNSIWGTGYVDEDMPEVMLGADGKYGFRPSQEGDVIDSRALTGQAALQMVMGKEKRQVDPQAMEKRREAIAQVMGASQRTMSRSNSASSSVGRLPEDIPPLANGADGFLKPNQSRTRTFSRSASLGSQILNRPRSAGPDAHAAPSRLPPIPSASQEGSASQPAISASQASQNRRNAVQLEQERSKRVELEAQMQRMREEVDRMRLERQHTEQRQETAIAAGVETGTRPLQRLDGDDNLDKRLQELQGEVWKYSGEAATVRRARQVVSCTRRHTVNDQDDERHRAEVQRLQAVNAEAETRYAEREKEVQRQLESLRSQAVFSVSCQFSYDLKPQVHAVHQSVGRSRQAPSSTPLRNGTPSPRSSPSKKASQSEQDVTATLRAVKGKGSSFPEETALR